MITVLIVDDQALVRGGLRLIIDAQDDLEVVGEAENGAEAIIAAERLEPDVVLMDIRMPELDGIAATTRLAQRGTTTRVLMLTTFDDDQLVYDAMRAGASGFLLKSAPPAQLTGAVRIIAAGDALLAPSITRRLIEEFVDGPPPGTATTPAELAELTEREREVLTLLARGLSNTEIATQLVVGEATVKTHVNHLLSKLKLRDRVQAVVLAYETGYVRRGK